MFRSPANLQLLWSLIVDEMNLREHTPLFAHVRTIFDAGVGRMSDVRTQTQLLAQNKVFLKTVMAGVQKLVPDVNAAREKRPSITIAAENEPAPILEDIIHISTPPGRRVSFAANVSSYEVPAYDIPPYDVPSTTPIAPIITAAPIVKVERKKEEEAEEKKGEEEKEEKQDAEEEEEEEEEKQDFFQLQKEVTRLQKEVTQLQTDMESIRQILSQHSYPHQNQTSASPVPVIDSGSSPPASSVA